REVLAQSLRAAGRRLSLTESAPTSHVPEVVAVLLSDGTPASLRAAARVFDGRALVLFWAGQCKADVYGAMARGKVAQPHAFYLQSLRCTHVIPGVPITELAAEDICQHLGRDDPTIEAIKRKYATLEDRIPHLEQWLKDRIAAPK